MQKLLIEIKFASCAGRKSECDARRVRLLTLRARATLAEVLQEKDEDACLTMYEDVVALMSQHVGEQSRWTLNVKLNLAYAVGDVFQQFERARVLKQEVVDGLSAVLGANHPETLTARNNLAATVERLGDRHLARQMYEEVYDTQRVQLGSIHPDTILSKYNVANVRCENRSAPGRVQRG